MRINRRRAVAVLAVLALAGATGCGGSDNSDGGNTSGKSAGRASPDTEGALLTILSYGRAAQASEVCPLLSAAYAKQIGGGNAANCNPRTGKAQTVTLVREGDSWKIDKLDPPKV
jgi:hypothetical protein